MPVIQFSNISHQLSSGEYIFRQLTGSMNKKRVGLLGRNGSGKSVLAAILAGDIQPAEGTVCRPEKIGIFHQQNLRSQAESCSIAEFLGKHRLLDALKQIKSGDPSQKWFELVGDEWDAEEKIKNQLADIGIVEDLNMPCKNLSGGQWARLQLWQLLGNELELLILDEPSNHLDLDARKWLLEMMDRFKGAILLISHDRSLLQQMDEIWELSNLGLSVFGGNYDNYFQQKNQQDAAVNRQLAEIDKQIKYLKVQTQVSRERAEQRAAQGNRLRKDGSQPKVLLDGKKDMATANASNLRKNIQVRQSHLINQEQILKARQSADFTPKILLADNPHLSHKLVSIAEGKLPFGCDIKLNLQINASEKVHLIGKNGCGKSTLMRVLLGEIDLVEGQLRVNAPLYYLDQHFSVLKPEGSLLHNLMTQCSALNESQARTLLAGIGFRRSAVFQTVDTLSGGEKMKLAMLIAGHQSEQPLLLLDEPDNHLDLQSKLVLAEVLSRYRGGFVLVSHDQQFAREAGLNRQIVLS